ncbi:MAG: riboflavin synthase, partial [Planctomycetota bacterium]
QGHVDAVGEVVSAAPDLVVRVPTDLLRYVVEKGSIAVDGVSLTLARIRGRSFAAALIPETLRRTTLSLLRPGDPVHLEADVVGKWIEALSTRARR